ncbi:hypothetical protein SYN60AY4M2_13730 [Synechococcus sp. 60AY4M2]|nr:hypothetical protein SYN60AY4M2_13730 [Synechococcus sp. 60AY4M2]PIK99334.1 hypothetical protein SYN65AY640_13495 [Synechococcus sp. 65AY640]
MLIISLSQGGLMTFLILIGSPAILRRSCVDLSLLITFQAMKFTSGLMQIPGYKIGLQSSFLS